MLGGPAQGILSFTKVCSIDAALAQVKSWRSCGARIAFRNDCFDLLHPGHVHLLQQAKDLGDRLFVSLHSGPSIRRLKGPGRPMLHEGDRSALL